MVKLAEEKLMETRKEVIFLAAEVKYGNTASARVFEKCCYKPYFHEDYIEYQKQLR